MVLPLMQRRGEHASTTIEGPCFLRGLCTGVILKTNGATIQLKNLIVPPIFLKITPPHGPRNGRDGDHIENTVILLHACTMQTLSTNGCCLQSHCLATGLYATIYIFRSVMTSESLLLLRSSSRPQRRGCH
jgi:hypothetical protein